MSEEIDLNGLPENLTQEEVEMAKARQRADKAHASVSMERKLSRYWRERAELLDEQLEASLLLADYEPDVEPVTPLRGKKSSESAACLMLSDWHVEELVEGKTCNELNEFNLDVASARIRRTFGKSAGLIDMFRVQTRINHLVVILGGDHMTGYIHEELVENNELSPTETILWLIDHITEGLDGLLKDRRIAKISVLCVVGNHGRTTQKPRVATGYKNSYEWLMYHNLRRIYREKSSRITFQIADGYHLWREVFGMNLRVHHGDAIRYQGGVGGISIPVNKAIQQWNQARKADLDVFGHWHQMLDGRTWIANGSLIGYNAYAVKIKAGFERPSQQLFLIEKEHGRTITAPVLL